MNIFEKNINRIDKFQKRFKTTAFAYAVIKKYGEDEAGYQAALLTYYSFLALFPLLLILTTLTTTIAHSHPELQSSIVHGAANYFPVLGSQLAEHVHSLHKNGLALLIGILFILYGTHGLADVFRRGVQDIWGIPKSERAGFPKSTLSSLLIIVVGGLGFCLAAVCAGVASSSHHETMFRVAAILANLFVLFLLFIFLINLSLPKRVTINETWVGPSRQ